MIGRYHNTFADDPFSCHLHPHHHPLLYILIPLIWDTYAILRILFYTVYNHLDKHVFFGTPYLLDTISSWSAMYYLEEVFHTKIQVIQ